MYKAVIFDLDDTLYMEKDYVYSGFEYINKYISEKYKIENVSCELFIQFQSRGSKNVFNDVLDYLKINYSKKDINDLINIYRSHKPNIKLLKESEEIINYLNENNYLTGIITDGYKISQRNKIKSLGLDNKIKYIVITDELGREFWKPSLIPYKKICKDMKIDFKECIYIGDNISKDFIGAKKLGILTIRIVRCEGIYFKKSAESEYEADIIINDLRELINILD